MDSPIGKVVVSAVYEGGAAERHGEWGQQCSNLGMVQWLSRSLQENQQHPLLLKNAPLPASIHPSTQSHTLSACIRWCQNLWVGTQPHQKAPCPPGAPLPVVKIYPELLGTDKNSVVC